MSELIKAKLIDFICFNYMVDEDSLVLDESLVEQAIIDSFGLVEISSFLQSEFKITIQGSELNRANFGSILKMVSFVANKKITGETCFIEKTGVSTDTGEQETGEI